MPRRTRRGRQMCQPSLSTNRKSKYYLARTALQCYLSISRNNSRATASGQKTNTLDYRRGRGPSDAVRYRSFAFGQASCSSMWKGRIIGKVLGECARTDEKTRRGVKINTTVLLRLGPSEWVNWGKNLRLVHLEVMERFLMVDSGS